MFQLKHSLATVLAVFSSLCLVSNAQQLDTLTRKPLKPPRKSAFVFDPSIQQLRAENEAIYQLYVSGKDEVATQEAYDDLRFRRPARLAGFLNIAASLQTLKPESFLSYYMSIVTIRQDRFFAFASENIIDEIEAGVKNGTLKKQGRFDLLLHRGSTSSYKEIDRPGANVQITLHRKVTATINGVSCILVETDIDYFKGAWKHTFLEVIPNLALRRKTNPRKVYRIRLRGDDEFNPPYAITASKH